MLLIGLFAIFTLSDLSIDENAVLEGTVRDSDNNIYIRGAVVKIKNEDERQVYPTVLTDAAQEFRIEELPVGDYIVKAEFSGFEPERKEVELEANKETEIKFELTLKDK